MDNGGLKTDGLGVDPVSGNEIPAGSNAEDVRDDVDANLSAGEYVVPADVVRYFGVAHFEKLREKAQNSLEDMQTDGRIGGDDGGAEEATLQSDLDAVDSYAQGGLVEGTNVDGIISRVKAAAMKDPSVVNMLKAQGISIDASHSEPPSIEGQNEPRDYAEGGLVGYQTSTFDPQQHRMGFSLTNPNPSFTPAPVCPDGYAWNASNSVCEPIEKTAAEKATEVDDKNNGDRGAPDGVSDSSGSSGWMEQFNYADPDALFEGTMKTLDESGQKTSGLLGGLVDRFNNSLLGGAIGSLLGAQTSAQAAANAITLEAMGRKDLAAKITEKNTSFITKNNLDKVPDRWMNGTKLAEQVAESKKDMISEAASRGDVSVHSSDTDAALGGSYSGGGSNSGNTSSSSTPSITGGFRGDTGKDLGFSSSVPSSTHSSSSSNPSGKGLSMGTPDTGDSPSIGGYSLGEADDSDDNDSSSPAGGNNNGGMHRGGLMAPKSK